MARPNNGTFECPNCGEDVPRDSIVCPSCGSDDETGWSQDTDYDDLDLPTGYGEDDFAPATKERIWKIVAILLLVMIGFITLAKIW